jgi:hypothetical protein
VRGLKIIAIGIAGLALSGFVIFQIGAASNYQKNSRPPREHGSEQSQSKQEKSRETPKSGVVRIECEPNCTAKESDDNGNEKSILGFLYEYFEKLLRDPVASFTGALVMATFLLATIAGLQVRDGRILQRAYVSVRENGIRDSSTGRLLGHVIFANVGHLPAGGFNWVVRLSPGDERWCPPKLDETAMDGEAVLPIGAEWKKESDGTDLGTAIDDPFLYVWGRVTYKDGFRRRKRYANFCHRYPRDKKETPSGGGLYIRPEHARYHEYGNDAD